MVSAQRPPLLLMHGWMDVGASFQFTVDALVHERHVVAADWRGFGLSAALLPILVLLGFAAVFWLLALARFRWEEV